MPSTVKWSEETKCPDCGGKLYIEENAQDPDLKACEKCSRLFYKSFEIKW